MIRLVFILIFAASTVQAQQTVNVRGGEHDGFTRIVLTVDPAMDWSLDAQHDTATLSFPETDLQFVTHEVFSRIPRSRLLAVGMTETEAGSALQFTLACACPVTSFAFKDAYIVIDFLDGPPLEPLPEAVAATPPLYWQPQTLALAESNGDPLGGVLSIAPQEPTQLFEEPATQDDTGDVSALNELTEDTAVPLTGPELDAIVLNPLTSEDPEMLRRIEEAQSQLLEQLGRAADQGLLEFIPDEVEVPEQEVVEIIPEPAAPPVPAVDPELLKQLSARTAYDQGTEEMLTQVINEFAKPQCLDNSDFTMVGWNNGQSFADQIAPLRAGLVGEFDQHDGDRLESLVHLYLWHGFGAEAALLLREPDWQLENSALLLDFATILHGVSLSQSGPVSKGRGCGGAHEMWYLLGAESGAEVLEATSVIEAFSSYPIGIRTMVGPDLAAAFSARNQFEHAHIVLEIVRRADGVVMPGQRLAEARVLENNGDPDAAMSIYKAVANSSSDAVPDALIALARLTLAGDHPVTDELLVDLGAAAHLARGTPIGESLRLWEIRIEARAKGMALALASVSGEISRAVIDHDSLRDLVGEVLEGASISDSGPLEYVQLVLAFQELLVEDVRGDDARVSVAKNLIAVGLPEPALDILSAALPRDGADVNRVAARALLQLYRHDEALRFVKDDDTPEAIQIRLDAEMSREQYNAAAQMLPEATKNGLDVSDAAWRTGAWQQLPDDDVARVLAAYTTKPADELIETDANGAAFLSDVHAPQQPDLQKARDLLEVNRASRSYLEDLLAMGQD